MLQNYLRNSKRSIFSVALIAWLAVTGCRAEPVDSVDAGAADISVFDVRPDTPESVDAIVDASADAMADGEGVDAGPTCEPFEASAPPPTELGECVETLSRVELPTRQEVDADMIVDRDVFVAQRGEYALHADLFVPVDHGNTGALVVVHGGGWLDCSNRRDDVEYFARGIAEGLRIPTFNIDYRLAQEGGGYPNNVTDVKCAVQWLRSHAEELGFDGERIGIMGTSAGAHLALMVALTSDRDDLDPECADVGEDVQLTLSYAGPSDLPTFVESTSEAREAPRLYTGEPCDVPVTCLAGRGCTRCEDASPLAHACRPVAAPVFLMQAPDPYDPLVSQLQAELLADALTTAGTPNTLIIPTDAEMRVAGCTPEGGSHAADLCMIRASQDVVNPAIVEALGVR